MDIEPHRKFIHQVFKRRANLEGRSHVEFITTNYDTLLEDALVLERRIPRDGFLGAAIAFWNGEGIDDGADLPSNAHRVLKLHGSVDWFRHPDLGLLRVRYGVRYLADLAQTLIYPQATKYIEAQKDPFANIFGAFRRALMVRESHVLVIVGYSFGDDHINAEIENALEDKNNRTIVVAFSKEIADTTANGESRPCQVLERWRENAEYGSRIYVASDKALYSGATRLSSDEERVLDWWTFSGLISFLSQGSVA